MLMSCGPSTANAEFVADGGETMKAAVMRYVIALGMVGALTMNLALARHQNQLGSRHTTNMNMAQYCLPKENDPDQTKIYCRQDDGQIIWKE